MALPDDELREKLSQITEIHVVLLGANGSPGLAQRFEEVAKSHYGVKRLLYGLIAFLSGSGVLGCGYGLFQFLIGD